MARLSAAALLLLLGASSGLAAGATEFCLEGAFDLAARYQGTDPARPELTDVRWCVVTEDLSERVLFSASGKSNPDLVGSWAVAFLPPDLVRIVNRDSPPDVEFDGAPSHDDARRHRRIDPKRLLEELEGGDVEGLEVERVEGLPSRVTTAADLPLRGRVPVVWNWEWSDPGQPSVAIEVDGEVLFTARGGWRQLGDAEAAALWQPTPGAEPIQAPADQWPARVDMRLLDVADGVFLVRGVRTGFHHLVVDTEGGLVVADAPAGWVEIHQLPPTDLVPGLGISGLSEKLVDFLGAEFPDRPIRAVALTHAHDDHAGGARAFAVAGATVYAPAESAEFLEQVLDSEAMPEDRLARRGGSVVILPVSGVVRLDDPVRPVELHSLGAGPHVSASLAVYAPKQKVLFVSDLHVPSSDAEEPRPERAETECWFATWAVQNLPGEARVLNSRSAPETPVSRLNHYLASPLCSG